MEKMISQARIFAITEILYENHLEGIANKELAKSVGTTQSNICRDMALFEQFGWAERNFFNLVMINFKYFNLKLYIFSKMEAIKCCRNFHQCQQ